MVKIMENPIKMDDLGVRGTPIFGNTHINTPPPLCVIESISGPT